MITATEVRLPPARWWREPQAIAAFRLTPRDCDDADQLWAETLAAEEPISMEASGALDAMSRQLDDAFVEDELLALSQRFVRAQARGDALERELADRLDRLFKHRVLVTQRDESRQGATHEHPGHHTDAGAPTVRGSRTVNVVP